MIELTHSGRFLFFFPLCFSIFSNVFFLFLGDMSHVKGAEYVRLMDVGMLPRRASGDTYVWCWFDKVCFLERCSSLSKSSFQLIQQTLSLSIFLFREFKELMF